MSKKKLEPIVAKSYYAWFAHDGNVQITTLSPDVNTLLAFTKLANKAGVCQSVLEMHKKGFTIQQVALTVIPMDNEIKLPNDFLKKFNS